jgi:hypothetical protein
MRVGGEFDRVAGPFEAGDERSVFLNPASLGASAFSLERLGVGIDRGCARHDVPLNAVPYEGHDCTNPPPRHGPNVMSGVRSRITLG